VKGYLDQISPQAGLYALTGWATAAETLKPAATVLVFSEGKQVYAGRPGSGRPDLVKFFGTGTVLESGFRFTLPKGVLKNRASLRLFAVSHDGAASELTIDEAVRNTLKSSE
jgi:hypothetical protein